MLKGRAKVPDFLRQERQIQLPVDSDLTTYSFEQAWSKAWEEVCGDQKKLVWPDTIYTRVLSIELGNWLQTIIKGDIVLCGNAKSDYLLEFPDEWWLTFVSTDGDSIPIVFYSPGA